ncbi:hypothetical protein SLA2020_249070 [Shorea laevis]
MVMYRLNTEAAYRILFYGSGALVALRLASAVVGAIESIPLLATEDAYPILLYGSGALVALWLASAVHGAIESVPLFPKLMEVVGLGYTVWFSSRYLLFKVAV